MKKIGCTTPFGFNRDNICNDTDKGKVAMDLFRKLRAEKRVKDCLYPCTNLKIRMDRIEFAKLNGTTRFKLQFEQFIRVTSSYVSYTGLELVAEVGGYVGLFLGFSILHLTHAFEYVIQLILSSPYWDRIFS